MAQPKPELPCNWPLRRRVLSIDTRYTKRYTSRDPVRHHHMDTFFLACFAFGALFTLASVVLGLGGHGAAHAAHGQSGGFDLVHHVHVGGHQALHPATSDPAAGRAAPGSDLPWLNASSVIGGLTWFGAAGLLLTRLGDLALPAVLLGALLAGAIGWYLVTRFLGFVLSGEREMDPLDYRLEGTVGTVTVGIPAGGTGEIVFTKAGARRSEAARALESASIPRGTEVVITSYARGFATVQPWTEFLGARDATAVQNREA